MKFYIFSSLSIFLATSITKVTAQGGPPGPPPQPTLIFTDTTLSAPSSSPIIIAADDITLDCGGNSIGFPGAPNFISGITLDNRKGITIKDCVINNWLFGIRLEAFSSVTLENISIKNSVVNGLDANDSSRILMKGSFESMNNGVFGINMNQDVSLTMRGANANISGNTAGVQIALRSSLVMDAVGQNPPSTLVTSNNNFFGITATSNSHLFLFGAATVESRDNGSNGLTVFTKSAVEVDRQGILLCDGNGLDGVRVEDSSVNLFSIDESTPPNFTSTNNGEAGVRLTKSGIFDTNNIAEVTITDNSGGGVIADNNSIATFRNAVIRKNGFANVFLSFGSHGDFEGNDIAGRIRCDNPSDVLTRGDERKCKQLEVYEDAIRARSSGCRF